MKRGIFITALMGVILYLLIGCTSVPKYTTPTKKKVMRWKVGEEYILESEIGTASFYGREFVGRTTSSGEPFDPLALTAAHNTYPLGTIVKVINLKNNESVIVRINDRGPLMKGRIIDLSQGAAERIKMVQDGVATVRIEVLEWGKE
jgi:rare lipoprotein A